MDNFLRTSYNNT